MWVKVWQPFENNMKATFIRILVLTALGSLFTFDLRAQVLDPNKPPGGNFNLTNFYLGLPVDSSGGTTGNSASIPAAQLVAGYTNALYFHTGADGAMVFWAPVTGATTSGSSFPRSELREQINPPSNSSNWIPFGTHVLKGQCRVTQIASTGKVIIGQIHCFTGNARPLLKLQFNNGVIEALVKTNSNFDPDFKQTFQNIGLSNLVTYQIKMENGQLTTTVNGVSQSINVFATDPDWATNGLYFKAGSYCQDNVGDTNEGARVAFYELSRSHAPALASQPVGLTVDAGSNATFNVAAVGNGPLRYQWRFNETKLLAGATNAVLTLTNVQAAQVGDYSVMVLDSLGAVTSAVAPLMVAGEPTITTQPADQIVIAGGTASFSVTANGGSPLQYQWRKAGIDLTDGGNVSGANSNLLVLASVSSGDVADYRVVVTNSFGSVTSLVASLSVTHFSDALAQYQTVVAGQSPAYHFKLDGTLTNSGTAGPLTLSAAGGWFTNGFSGVTNTARSLTASTDSLTTTTDLFAGGQTAVGGNASASGVGSVTLLFRALDTVFLGGQRFVFSQGNNSSDRNAFGLFFENQNLSNGDPGGLKLRAGNTTFTLISSNQLQTATWYYLAITYDESRDNGEVQWWLGPIGGVLTNGLANPANDAVIGNNGTVYLGNQTSGTAGFRDGSSHGRVDEFAVWHRELTPAEVTAQFTALTWSSPPHRPTLNIERVGGNVVLSWSTNDTAGYELWSTPSLSAPVWTAEGAPTIVGDANHVTNALTGDEKYYRLMKP